MFPKSIDQQQRKKIDRLDQFDSFNVFLVVAFDSDSIDDYRLIENMQYFFCKDMKGDREKEKIINLNYHFIKEYE